MLLQMIKEEGIEAVMLKKLHKMRTMSDHVYFQCFASASLRCGGQCFYFNGFLPGFFLKKKSLSSYPPRGQNTHSAKQQGVELGQQVYFFHFVSSSLFVKLIFRTFN